MLNDEEYIDVMRSVISSFYESNPSNKDVPSEEAEFTAILEKGYYHLTEQDKDLLEEYAPKLFAPQYNKKDSYQYELKSKYTEEEVYNFMLELAEYVGSYRYDKLQNSKSNEIYKPREKKKSQKVRETSFVNHINAILDFIGRFDIKGDDNQNALRAELVKARNAPAEYVKPVRLKTIQMIK